MKTIIKIILPILTLLFCITTNIFADTSIEGLPEKAPTAYDLRLEIFDNDAKKYLISIHPVNVLSILYYRNYFSEKPKTILKTKLTDDEYNKIYQKAYNALLNFKISEKPHLTKDASHYKLSLNVNRREISITYYSVSHIKEMSPNFHYILEIINRYLPQDEKLKY